MYYFIVKIFLTLLTCLIACAVVMHDWRKERQQLSYKERSKRIPNRYLFALIGVIISTLLSIFTDAHEQHERFEEEIAQSRRDSIVRAGIDSSLAVLYLVSAGLNATQEQIDDQGNQLMTGIERTTDELYGVSNSIDSGFENNFRRLINQQNTVESVYNSMILSQKISMSENYPIDYWILNFIIAYPIPESAKSVLAPCIQECNQQDSHSIGFKMPQCININCFDEMRGDIQIPINPPLRLNVSDNKNNYMRIVELFVKPINNIHNISYMHIQLDTLYVSYKLRVKNSSTIYSQTHPKLSLWDLDNSNLELDIYPYAINWNGTRGQIVSELLIDFEGSKTSLRIQPWDLCLNDYGTYSLSLTRLEHHIDNTSMLWGHDKYGPFVYDASKWRVSKCR